MVHVARKVDRSTSYKNVIGKLKRRDNMEDLHIDGRIILKWKLHVVNETID